MIRGCCATSGAAHCPDSHWMVRDRDARRDSRCSIMGCSFDWFQGSHPHGCRMIALFPSRVPTSSREGYQEIAYPPPISRVRSAWLRWEEKSFSAPVSIHMAPSYGRDAPDG